MAETQVGGGRKTSMVVQVNKVAGEKKMYVTASHPPLKLDPSALNFQVIKKTRSCNQSVQSWWADPEAKRRRRVAKYKFYSAEGKVKHSLKKGFRWIQNKYARIISGF